MGARIIVLDGGTLNPGDLSWKELESLGSCAIYDRTPPAEIIQRVGGAEIVLTNKTVLDRQTILALPAVKYIGVLATGYNVVDILAAHERGIVVSNIPTYGTRSVAQMVFAHLLELTQHVGHHAQTVREGKWAQAKDFCYWDYPLVELSGLTMGIIGFGRIGQTVGKLADAFGMQVIAYDPTASCAPSYATLVDLDTLFSQSDVVSLHCPLTPENQELINAERLGMMKQTAFLINTSRGALVNETDLATALNNGQIAGAGLDVLSIEPSSSENPLLLAKNCYITPHIAWATHAARSRLLNTAVENVRAFLLGTPQNAVRRPK